MKKLKELLFGIPAIGDNANYPIVGNPKVNTVKPNIEVGFNCFIESVYNELNKNYLSQHNFAK
jgi:hypothetical protein